MCWTDPSTLYTMLDKIVPKFTTGDFKVQCFSHVNLVKTQYILSPPVQKWWGSTCLAVPTWIWAHDCAADLALECGAKMAANQMFLHSEAY